MSDRDDHIDDIREEPPRDIELTSPADRWLNFARRRVTPPPARWSADALMIRDRYDAFFAQRARTLPASEEPVPTPPAELEPEPDDDLPPADPLADVERSSHFMLDQRWKDLLAETLDIRIPSVQVYVNEQSDALAAAHQADAVTRDDKVFFRAGKYQPDTPRGAALLGHELTHAANVAQGTYSEQPSVEEEASAIRNEQRVLDVLRHTSDSTPASLPSRSPQTLDPPPVAPRPTSSEVAPPLPAVPTSALSPPAAPSPAHAPTPAPSALRAAAAGRSLEEPPATRTATSFELTAAQMARIKDEVYRDLINRMRTEFERGG